MRSSTLTQKLILNLLFVGIGAIVIVGSLSFYTAKNALMNRTYEQLTSLRVLKKNHGRSGFWFQKHRKICAVYYR